MVHHLHSSRLTSLLRPCPPQLPSADTLSPQLPCPRQPSSAAGIPLDLEVPPPRPKRKATKPYPRKADTGGGGSAGNLEGMVTQVRRVHCCCPAWPLSS